MLGYFTTIKVQEGLYEIRFLSGRLILDARGSVIQSFKSRKEARAFITKNWENLKYHN